MTKQSNIDTTDTFENERGSGFFLNNTRTLGIIGIILLLVVGAGVWYIINRGGSNDRAQIELARIRPYYDRGEFQVAINGDSSKRINGEKIRGLRDIVQDWKGVPAGKIAALFLGNSYLATGQTPKAEEPYEIAAGADDDLLTSAAHAGLAAVAEAGDKYEDAAKAYEKAASEDHLALNTPQYLLGAARNYERAGNKDEAIKNYRTVATQYSQSAANTQARLALARFNVEL
jgi:tetratricopeptide (TPR) repeat protein